MPIIVGILTFMSRKNSILGFLSPKNAKFPDIFIYEHLKFHAQLSWAWKKFFNLGPSSMTPLHHLLCGHSKSRSVQWQWMPLFLPKWSRHAVKRQARRKIGAYKRTKNPSFRQIGPDIRKYNVSIKLQSTLVISNLKGPSETLRDIRSSTYQIFRIEENTNRTTKFNKWICK